MKIKKFPDAVHIMSWKWELRQSKINSSVKPKLHISETNTSRNECVLESQYWPKEFYIVIIIILLCRDHRDKNLCLETFIIAKKCFPVKQT